MDDGGSPVTGYVIEKTDANYSMWKVVPGFCPKCAFTVKVSFVILILKFIVIINGFRYSNTLYI